MLVAKTDPQARHEGITLFAIDLPRIGETLGLQFSVFGTCPEITATNSPSVTVKVMDGNTQLAITTAERSRGMALMQLNRFEEALPCFDRAIALKPDAAEFFGNRGNTLLALQRFGDPMAFGTDDDVPRSGEVRLSPYQRIAVARPAEPGGLPQIGSP